VFFTLPAWPLNAMEKTETATDGTRIKDRKDGKLRLLTNS
jgi:hypothetical protein